MPICAYSATHRQMHKTGLMDACAVWLSVLYCVCVQEAVPGCNCVGVPLVCAVAGKVNMRVQQLDVAVSGVTEGENRWLG